MMCITGNFDVNSYNYSSSTTIAYFCDDQFVHVLGVSLLSLLESQNWSTNLVIFIFFDHVSPKNIESISALCNNYVVKFALIDISKLFVPSYAVSKMWTRSAFARVYMGELLPTTLEKVLYLDCDTLVIGSIENLWHSDVSNVILAAAQDCPLEKHKIDLGLSTENPYINSGVLLINLIAFREIVNTTTVNEIGERFSRTLVYPDQDILNTLIKGQVLLLEPKYNAMTLYYEFNFDEILQFRRPSSYYSRSAISEACRSPVILHFTASFLTKRPWIIGATHPFKEVYMTYRSRISFGQSGVSKDSRPLVKRLYSKLFNILPRATSLKLSTWIYNQEIIRVRGVSDVLLKIKGH